MGGEQGGFRSQGGNLGHRARSESWHGRGKFQGRVPSLEKVCIFLKVIQTEQSREDDQLSGMLK